MCLYEVRDSSSFYSFESIQFNLTLATKSISRIEPHACRTSVNFSAVVKFTLLWNFKICGLEDTMTKKKSPSSLYDLCIDETVGHLLEKYWKKNTNPFSQVNCNIVNDLFRFLDVNVETETPGPYKLLLKSGQLQNFELDGTDFTKKQWRSIMTILLEEGDSCRNITCILLPKSFQNDESATLERLIQKCPLLEILVVSTFFNPFLMGCPPYLHKNVRTDTVPRFGLKECFWGFNSYVNEFKPRKQIAYTQQYSEFVKSSVALYPLVEKLSIVVYHKNCLEHLKKLRHLRVLKIDFNLCRGSPARTAFILMLSEIGPQLKCLSIVGRIIVPVDVVMKYCSNLVHLVLRCSAIIQGGIETDSKNFRQLKRLIVFEVNEESLKYLLRNSVNLKELLLYDALCLDDTLLHKILKMKSLSKIDTLGVKECRLSREGLKELIQKCANLESVAFENLDDDLTTVAEELKRDIRSIHSYMARSLLVI
ncbi:uncharacterized protein CEXT_358371 [Caerostris extrusa]|uniref:Uncharacterized protein n=1 Tax=Caerostris extrusa TaxID=172846 RepID=A0AAV4NFR8_CAEEX|nr:uncharacterized protein CEXT_358371 [Caerostris extrusa]